MTTTIHMIAPAECVPPGCKIAYSPQPPYENNGVIPVDFDGVVVMDRESPFYNRALSGPTFGKDAYWGSINMFLKDLNLHRARHPNASLGFYNIGKSSTRLTTKEIADEVMWLAPILPHADISCPAMYPSSPDEDLSWVRRSFEMAEHMHERVIPVVMAGIEVGEKFTPLSDRFFKAILAQLVGAREIIYFGATEWRDVYGHKPRNYPAFLKQMTHVGQMIREVLG